MKHVFLWIKTHTYCLALLYWLFYLVSFFSLEKWVVPKYFMQTYLDQQIPFSEWFIIPYCMWFPLLVISQLYFMLKSKEDFQNLCFLMFTGMTICLFIYMVLPNGLNLRTHVPNRNILCIWVNALYGVDTASNVCPSIHVSSTVAINCVVQRSQCFTDKKGVLWGSRLLTVLICLSTLMLKQHALIDVLCGFLLTQILYQITYRLDWRQLLARTRLKILL